MLQSLEADIYPLRDPEAADLIDGALGDGSPFHLAYGYYAHGVSPRRRRRRAGGKSAWSSARSRRARPRSGLWSHGALSRTPSCSPSAPPVASATGTTPPRRSRLTSSKVDVLVARVQGLPIADDLRVRVDTDAARSHCFAVTTRPPAAVTTGPSARSRARVGPSGKPRRRPQDGRARVLCEGSRSSGSLVRTTASGGGGPPSARRREDDTALYLPGGTGGRRSARTPSSRS
jgi:hypothetical protein